MALIPLCAVFSALQFICPFLIGEIIILAEVIVMFEGTIIKETLTDESLLHCLIIDKVDIWKTNNTIRYWTVNDRR